MTFIPSQAPDTWHMPQDTPFTPPVQFRVLRAGAKPPERATRGSAGYDLRAFLPKIRVLLPGQSVPIPTGIAIHLKNPNLVGIVAPRSGLGTRHGIVLSNTLGVIDSDYTGELIVHLLNRGSNPYNVMPDERIAQLLIMPCFLPDLVEVQQFEATERGSGGFGSTGR